MKRCSTRSHRWARTSALLAVAAFGTACVTAGTHSEVVDQRDALQKRVQQLERSSESLGAERVKLIDELEDLRITQEKLDKDVRRLRRTEEDLATNLAAREAELAKRTSEVEKLRGTYEGLVEDLEAEVAAGEIEIEQLREGLRLNLSQDVLFSSGSPDVNRAGRDVLRRVAERVRSTNHAIVVRGHTDNVPIASKRFPSNWELAGARAAGVVRLLAAGGVGPGRLSAVSHGETQPRMSNATPEGRARNRRIEITLQPVRARPEAQESPAGKPSTTNDASRAATTPAS